ncbi:MAG: DUF58 domain-containing protein [Rhodothermaceae bacterium]|nr:DUF58 domain-containing protein [Rhodothermaceae bacterium]
MELKELFKKIRQIEIRTKGLVEEVFGGEYHTAFKGQGMEFAEVRPYQFGDDIRSIDWNVTARTGETYIKKFEEEREQTLMLVVDISGSELFGSKYKFKREIAAEISAIIAFSAIRNNDKVGLILFSDQIELFVPPKKGKRHVLRLIRDLFAHDQSSFKTNISVGLDRVLRVLKRRSIVILISDFYDSGYERPLRAVSSRHDTIAIHLHDPREEELPAVGLLDLTDAETGETITLDTGSLKLREAYTEDSAKHRENTDTALRKARVDRVLVHTDEGYVEPLIQFFRRRNKKR